MSTLKLTKASEVARATQLIAGIQKHLANVPSITVASAAYTPAQITAAFQLLVTLLTDVATARTVVKAKLATETAEAPALRSLISAFVSYVKLTFSKSPDVLADFGLTPKKAATPQTTEEKVVAVAKRASTRKARGTTSKKAKKAIKGNVVSVVLTPVEAPQPVAAAPAAPTAPAPVQGGSGTGGGTPHGA